MGQIKSNYPGFTSQILCVGYCGLGGGWQQTNNMCRCVYTNWLPRALKVYLHFLYLHFVWAKRKRRLLVKLSRHGNKKAQPSLIYSSSNTMTVGRSQSSSTPFNCIFSRLISCNTICMSFVSLAVSASSGFSVAPVLIQVTEWGTEAFTSQMASI